MPFLTLLDDRAKPKGSRDPLGFELVWTHFGRRVISNLTTITNSLTNFSVALLGFHWANRLHEAEPVATKVQAVRETFLRYEQMAAYLRYLAGDREIMGITRVTQRIRDESHALSLGLDADQQILSDQTSYGLWGLYSMAMRDSGLVLGDARSPTNAGRALAEAIESRLDAKHLIDLMLVDGRLDRAHLERCARKFLKAVTNEGVLTPLLAQLMRGSERNSIQQEVWRITQSLAGAGQLSTNKQTFIDTLKQETSNDDLKARLSDIEAAERLLVAANNVFNYCRAKDGTPLGQVTRALSGRYSYANIDLGLDLHTVPRGDRLAKIRGALLAADAEETVRAVLDLNAYVMSQRDGAPWVELEAGGALHVRVPSETAALRSAGALETDWDYEYFLSSYLTIASRALASA
jgi:hypothetical protein